MLTYSDFEKADDKAKFVMSAISTYRNSDEYRVAKRADVPLFDMAAQDMAGALRLCRRGVQRGVGLRGDV